MAKHALKSLALAAALPACWVPIEQGQLLEADLVKLKGSVEATRREREEDAARSQRERDQLKAEQDAAVKKVDAKVKELSEAQEALNRAARKTGADLAVDLEKTQGEVARLRGQLEEVQARNQVTVQVLQEELARARADLSALTSRLASFEDERRAAKEAAAEAERKKAERPASKDEFYKAAKEKLDGGDVAGARQLFGEFLQKWKDDSLAANSQYWIGESYYAERRWREAVYEFKKVSDNYPKSDKAPDALLKIGYAFAELGLAEDARLFLDEVQRTYPKSNAAKLARERADALKKAK
jgi:tol-pal system protein YbgF